jgi:hypothetical protein
MNKPIVKANIGSRMMPVTPSPALLRSGFVYDIVHSRRSFAVNLDTGVLTVLSNDAIRGPEPIYRFRSGGAFVDVVLSRDWGIAKEQLLDLSVDVPQGSFHHGRVRISFSGSYREFSTAVSVYYRACVHKQNRKK